MTDVFKTAWHELTKLFYSNPKQLQVAALCYRKTELGKDVLLITSRDTGRWIIPKGWPIDGLNNSDAALQEAWEEAGVKTADVSETPMGQFDYPKKLNSGNIAEIETQVFLTKVTRLEDKYPERHQRKRKWVSPEEAANMVQEPGLKSILRDL